MRPMIRYALAPAAALLVGVAPVTVTAAGAAPTPRPVIVTIKSFAFSPATVRVKLGQKITVRNADTMVHTMTEGASHGGTKMPAPGFDTKDIGVGKSATVTPKKTGTYAFHCHIHPTMSGKVIVSR